MLSILALSASLQAPAFEDPCKWYVFNSCDATHSVYLSQAEYDAYIYKMNRVKDEVCWTCDVMCWALIPANTCPGVGGDWYTFGNVETRDCNDPPPDCEQFKTKGSIWEHDPCNATWTPVCCEEDCP